MESDISIYDLLHLIGALVAIYFLYRYTRKGNSPAIASTDDSGSTEETQNPYKSKKEACDALVVFEYNKKILHRLYYSAAIVSLVLILVIRNVQPEAVLGLAILGGIFFITWLVTYDPYLDIKRNKAEYYCTTMTDDEEELQ